MICGTGAIVRSVHRQRGWSADERLVHCGQQRHRHGCLQHDREIAYTNNLYDPHHWKVTIVGQPVTDGVGYSQYSTGQAELRSSTARRSTINMTAVNLEPGSTHPIGLYAGSCAAEGAQLFVPLKPLVADGNGSASATSTVVNVKPGPYRRLDHHVASRNQPIEPDRAQRPPPFPAGQSNPSGRTRRPPARRAPDALTVSQRQARQSRRASGSG